MLTRYLMLVWWLCLECATSDAQMQTAALSVHLSNVWQDSTSCVLPFNRVGNLLLVKAKADTLEGNFVLDTGAPDLVLNPTYFRDFPVTVLPDQEQSSISGTGNPVYKTIVGELTLGTLHYFRKEADMVNLGAIENARGVKILGLLGVALFDQCHMIIDFENSLIYLHRCTKRDGRHYVHPLLADTVQYRTFPISTVHNRIIASSIMAGKKFNWLIDCAAESNLLDSRLPDNILGGVTVTGKVKLTGAGSRQIDALTGYLEHLFIGRTDMGRAQVTITNLENTCFSGPDCVDGVIGFEFLSHHRVGFNFVQGKLYIWK